MKNNIELWNNCLGKFKDNLSEQVFEQWFKPISPMSYEDNTLILQIPSDFYKEYIEEHHLDLLRKVLYSVYGNNVSLKYRVRMVQQPETNVVVDGTKRSTAVSASHQGYQQPYVDPFKQRAYDDIDPQLNPNYTFENYYPSVSNELARSVGEAIATHPNNLTYNPLFLFGPSGVGKTHLIQAIGVKIKELQPQKRVLYITSRLFEAQYTSAATGVNNHTNDFINFYQSIDVLIIDDIQELAGKRGTQNIFFHIFNHLHQNGKQLILTSDCPPATLEGIMPRLLTRFKWGLMASLEKPDLALRKCILRNKVKEDGLSISEEVIDYIAQNVTENVRDLEGSIVSLMANATVLNRDITLELAERVISNVVKVSKPQITIDKIRTAVCEYYKMSVEALQMKSRKKDIVRARQVSMFLSKKYTDLSLATIGDIIGRKDHATVLHACKTITNELSVDKVLKSQLDEIELTLAQ